MSIYQGSTKVAGAINFGNKADLDSPPLTGIPTAPTAAVGTSTTQLATTAFVNAEIANDAPTKTGTGASGTWGISITGGAVTATKLAAVKTISLTGDVTGSVSTDLSGNASITATVVDDSHSHIISNVDGLQTALDAKALTSAVPTKKALTNIGADYTDFVIPLCSLDNTDISANLYAHGTIFLKRCNILGGQITAIDIICGKNYNSTIPMFSILKSWSSDTWKPVTFTYNSVLYFGIHIHITGASYDSTKYFIGTASDISIIDGIYVYNNNTSTILNTEIYNSLVDVSDSSYHKEIEFFKSPVVKPLGTTTAYKMWNETNDGAGSGLDADKLDNQEGSYYLDWTNTTNKPDPVITLAGDATGSVTLTDLTSGTLTVAVVDDSHNHIISNVDGLQTALDTKAALAGPTFTGTVTLPSTTSIGTVTNTKIGYLDGVTSAIQTQLDTKAPLASPALTGTPTAPTAAAGTNTTQVATTAFVCNEAPFVISATAPANTNKLWIDSSGIAYFYDGAAWVSIKGTYAD